MDGNLPVYCRPSCVVARCRDVVRRYDVVMTPSLSVVVAAVAVVAVTFDLRGDKLTDRVSSAQLMS